MSSKENISPEYVNGFLSAFSTINSYENHNAGFSFLPIPVVGDLENSLTKYFEPSDEKSKLKYNYKIALEEISSDIFSLQPSFKEWLFDTKPGFSERYEKIKEATRNDSAEMLANAIKGFFGNETPKIYKMTIGTTDGSFEEPYYESIYDDYIFQSNDKVFNLHFGVSD